MKIDLRGLRYGVYGNSAFLSQLCLGHLLGKVFEPLGVLLFSRHPYRLHTQAQKNKHKHTNAHTHMQRKRERQNERERGRDRKRDRERYEYIHAFTHTGTHTHTHTHTRTHRHTHTHTHTHTRTLKFDHAFLNFIAQFLQQEDRQHACNVSLAHRSRRRPRQSKYVSDFGKWR